MPQREQGAGDTADVAARVTSPHSGLRDVNRTVLRIAMGDLAGRILERADHDPSDDGRVAPLLDGVLVGLVARWHAEGRPVRSVAVSIANPVDPTTGRVVELPESAFPAGVVGTDDVRGVGPAMVVLDQDVNFAALAERDRGAAVGTPTFAYLYVGERHGVGMGLVIDGVLVRGARGLAGEIGYLPVGDGSGRFRFGEAVAAHGLSAQDADGDVPVPVTTGALGETAPLWGALAEARRRAWEALVSGRG